jgi:hypothetical protein
LARRREILGEKVAFSTSTKEGGDQIEYEDQDPRIHPIYLEELARLGLTAKMDRYFPAQGSPTQASRSPALAK